MDERELAEFGSKVAGLNEICRVSRPFFRENCGFLRDLQCDHDGAREPNARELRASLAYTAKMHDLNPAAVDQIAEWNG